jgi:hypothetical protein
MPVTELEVGNGEGLVDRGVGGHGEDHRRAIPIGGGILYTRGAKKR